LICTSISRAASSRSCLAVFEIARRREHGGEAFVDLFLGDGSFVLGGFLAQEDALDDVFTGPFAELHLALDGVHVGHHFVVAGTHSGRFGADYRVVDVFAVYLESHWRFRSTILSGGSGEAELSAGDLC
jgi:hypothetical protein